LLKDVHKIRPPVPMFAHVLIKFFTFQMLSKASFGYNPDDTCNELDLKQTESVSLLQKKVHADSGHAIDMNATKPTAAVSELESTVKIHTKDNMSIVAHGKGNSLDEDNKRDMSGKRHKGALKIHTKNNLSIVAHGTGNSLDEDDKRDMSGKRHKGAPPLKNRLPLSEISSDSVDWVAAYLAPVMLPVMIMLMLLPVLMISMERRSSEQIARAEGQKLPSANDYVQTLMNQETEDVERSRMEVHQKVCENKAEEIGKESAANESAILNPGSSGKEAPFLMDSKKQASLTGSFPGNM